MTKKRAPRAIGTAFTVCGRCPTSNSPIGCVHGRIRRRFSTFKVAWFVSFYSDGHVLKLACLTRVLNFCRRKYVSGSWAGHTVNGPNDISPRAGSSGIRLARTLRIEMHLGCICLACRLLSFALSSTGRFAPSKGPEARNARKKCWFSRTY